MGDKPKTLTLGELRERLNRLDADPDLPVKVWLPGTRVLVGTVFYMDGQVLIEGNVEEGSVLDEFDKAS